MMWEKEKSNIVARKCESVKLSFVKRNVSGERLFVDLANGLDRVGSGHGSKRVRVETGQLKKGLFLVRVEKGSGRNGFGLGWIRLVKKMFF
ncbi:hypothetical protein Hanom_Chr12g01123341 [Helianthus anomalus]